MQSYEVILIISPDADQDSVEESINTVTNFAKKNQGEILKSKNRGLKNLSYPIKSYNDAHHILMKAIMPPKEIISLDSILRSNEIIIRHFITKTNKTQEAEDSTQSEYSVQTEDSAQSEDSKKSGNYWRIIWQD